MSDVPPKRSGAKPLLIGCGVVVLILVLCAGGFAFVGAKGWKAFQAEWKRAAEDEKFAQEWTPPAEGEGGEVFAPESVAGYALAASDEKAEFPALGIEHAGTHAVYEKGGDTIDVAVYRVDEAETSAIFDEVERRIDDDDRFQSHTHVRLPRTLRFNLSGGVELHGLLWHAGGWLVFARSATVPDTDLDPFLKAYLAAVEETAAGAEGDTVGADGEMADEGAGDVEGEAAPDGEAVPEAEGGEPAAE